MLRGRVQRALKLPAPVLIKRLSAIVTRGAKNFTRRMRDAVRPSYAFAWPDSKLERIITGQREFPHGVGTEELRAVVRNYLNHRFDLLGSGWTEVRHGIQCAGVEDYQYPRQPATRPDRAGNWLNRRINRANLVESRRIWRLVEEGYVPIDWQLDFKSGYRWSESTWYLSIPYAHLPGVDVKVPWELARMQHAPQLALAFAAAHQAGGTDAACYVHEFRNQVLDFIATNPPRFGVNWRCAMDVSIRVTNWLIAYDLFCAAGAKFDEEFQSVLCRSVYEHASHVFDNLEGSDELRGNHYLADIVGLLFTATYLPRTDETDRWLSFAVGEVLREVELQFASDGTNFEASTAYHRLSAEMVVYATALLMGLKRSERGKYLTALVGYEPLPRPYMDRLSRMAMFVRDTTKPNGRVVQVGDNDSGRFIKLAATYIKIPAADAIGTYANLFGYQQAGDNHFYWFEDHLDHGHLIAAIDALFTQSDVRTDTRFVAERWVLKALSGGFVPPLCDAHPRVAPAHIGEQATWQAALRQAHATGADQMNEFRIVVPRRETLFGLDSIAYPEFGLYIFRSAHFFMSLRCGPIGQRGYGGHAHNDQLALELNVEGDDWIADPGTYVYTSLARRRDEYRSVHAHYVPRLSSAGEPSSFRLGCFRLDGEPKACCLFFGQFEFLGVHHGYGQPVYRLVRILESEISVTDWTVGPKRLEPHATAMISGPITANVPWSPGYGWRLQ